MEEFLGDVFQLVVAKSIVPDHTLGEIVEASILDLLVDDNVGDLLHTDEVSYLLNSLNFVLNNPGPEKPVSWQSLVKHIFLAHLLLELGELGLLVV